MSQWLARVRMTKASAPTPNIIEEPFQAVDVQTPLDALPAPVHIWSDILHTDVWVCATPAQAKDVQAAGTTVYLPAEIRVLRRLKARWPESFPEKLQAIHQSKAVFGALVVDAALPEAQEAKDPAV